jgi:hypothetical protein
VRLEAWSETAGKVPQLVTVAGPYGVPVYSGSGFNGLPGKRDAALHAPAGGHHTPMRERIARPADRDVTLTEAERITTQVRLAGGQTNTLDLPVGPGKSSP